MGKCVCNADKLYIYLRQGGYVFNEICLFVSCQDYSKTTWPVFTKFGKKVAHGSEKKWLDSGSVVISRPWSRESSALEFILSRSRSRSRDLMAKVWNLVSRPSIGLGLETACLVPTPVARSLAQTLSICHLWLPIILVLIWITFRVWVIRLLLGGRRVIPSVTVTFCQIMITWLWV